MTPPVPTTWRWWMPLLALFGAIAASVVVLQVLIGLTGADPKHPGPTVNLLGTVAQDVFFVGAVVAVARFVGEVAGPRPFGLVPAPWKSSTVVVIAGYLAFLVISVAYVKGLDLHDQQKITEDLGVDRSTAALLAGAVLVSVLAPIAEEMLFRGFAFPCLSNAVSLPAAAVVTGALFGLIHIGSSPAAFIVPLAVFGTLLCWVRVRTGSLLPCIALHSINNSIAYGNVVHWGWQIPVLLVGALVVLGGFARIGASLYSSPPS